MNPKEIKDLLSNLGKQCEAIRDTLRAGAYIKAAKTIGELDDLSLELHIKEGSLTTLPGIGKSIAEKIVAYVNDGVAPEISNQASQSNKKGRNMSATQKAKPQALQRATPQRGTIQALQQTYDTSKFNLLAPKIHVGELPAGTTLAVREVNVDPKSEVDVYRVDGGKLALSKVSLNKIASAAGINWLAEERTDRREHPHLCEYRVVGEATDFDGTKRRIYGTKCIDLREDAGGGIPGKDFDAITRAASLARPPRDPGNQLTQQRKFIDSICISKARNRAVSDILAMPRSFAPSELKKPFIVPKLMLDTSNPAAQQAVMANMLGATDALFGKREDNVVDMPFEEETASTSLGAEGEGGGSLPSSASSGPTGTPEVKAAIKESWKNAKTQGVTSDEFKSVCSTATSKNSSDEMTLADVKTINDALTELSEDCPV